MRGGVATFLFTLAAGAGTATADMAATPACDDTRAILTPAGTADAAAGQGAAPVVIAVELADDPASRARGLMNRPALPPGHGMLFVYDTPQPARFWMKNTLIPLDMLFIDAAGVVRHVHPNARPLDLTTIAGEAAGDPAPDRLMVLELAGGEAARLSLAPGTTLRHPRIPQATAADPCPPAP